MLQSHYQVIRPLTTAHLAQTMSMLSLTAAELRQQIDGELSSNPALELVDERRCPSCHRLLPAKGACPVCSRPRDGAGDEPIVFVSPREVYYGASGSSEEDLPEDRYSSMVEELPVYVFRQITPDIDPEDRRLAAYLLTNLDEDGLLTVSLLEAARYLHVPPSRLEKVKSIIQRADPVGVGSGSTEEALLVQLEVLAESRKIPLYASRIIREGMGLLSRHQYAELARQLKAPLAKVQEAARFISENLNPFPGRSSWGDNRHPSARTDGVYYQPDIIINRSNDRADNQLMVEIIMPLYGTLRVNPLYKQELQEVTGEQKDGLREDMYRAALFIKCLQQRNNTIQRLIQKVVMLQREFILKGEKHLIPVTRAQLAQELEVHESTVSRAVANKAVQMPNGRIIPLSSFFYRSLNVRTILREMIAEEPYPLSDSELVDQLSSRGINIARRTVAKYRAMEGILPANLRH
jgi:RNA polymerase sigma-54 factor